MGSHIHTAFIFATIVPIFLIILLGMLLKRKQIINDNFVAVSSRVIFTLTLPTLVFLKVSSLDATDTLQLPAIALIYGVTIGVFIVIWLLAARVIPSGRDMGAFMQGIYRGNFATVGLAASAGVYGAEGLAQAALFLAFVVPLYNVLGVIALVVPLGKEHRLTSSALAKEVFLNPIVLAVVAALPFAYFHISIPMIVMNTGNYLAELTIPLALLGIGGTLQMQGRHYSMMQAVMASLIKVVLMPLVGVTIALLCGFPAQTVGILFILFGCPTTMATFIMAQAMGANDKLASAIVVVATGMGAFTMVFGLYFLQRFFE